MTTWYSYIQPEGPCYGETFWSTAPLWYRREKPIMTVESDVYPRALRDRVAREGTGAQDIIIVHNR